MGRPMLNSSVLVLNRGYFPVHVTNARRAFCLLYSGLARAINGQYETFDYPSWSALAVAAGDPAIGVVGRGIRIPRVVVLVAYDRVPRRNVRFSRRNIFVRDRNTCQYCGKPFPAANSTWITWCLAPRGERPVGRTSSAAASPATKGKAGIAPRRPGCGWSPLPGRPAGRRSSPSPCGLPSTGNGFRS